MRASRNPINLYSSLLFLIVGFLTPACKSQVVKTVTAKDICSYVTKEMTSIVPQVPTLCVPKGISQNSFEMSVFSPTDVLEGKLRRTWSTALFVIFSELYFDSNLDGACKRSSTWLGCVFMVSDSYLSQHGGKQYQMFDPTSPSDSPHDPIHGDPSSDGWYKRWWFQLGLVPQFAHAGSQENARVIAENACTKYIAALRRDPIAIAQPENMPIPGCSVLLVTSTRADVMVSFANWLTPALVEYDRYLIEAFGKSFDGTPYQGTVIFRSAWNTTAAGKTTRSNWSYDLRDLEFDWEEFDSGVRPDAVFAPIDSEPGQTDLHSLSVGAGSGVVLKVIDGPGRGKIMDLTNGSEWLLAPDVKTQECAIVPGSRVVSVVGGMLLLDGSCEFNATFAGGW